MQISGVLTSLVFLVWVATLGPRLVAQITPATGDATEHSAGQDVFGVMASVGSALAGQWGQTKSMLKAVTGNPLSGAAASSTGSTDASATASYSDQNSASASAPASVMSVPSTIPSDDTSAPSMNQ